MKLSPPKNLTWLVALILAVLGVLGHTSVITFLTPYAFWLAVASAVLLLLASLLRGL